MLKYTSYAGGNLNYPTLRSKLEEWVLVDISGPDYIFLFFAKLTKTVLSSVTKKNHFLDFFLF